MAALPEAQAVAAVMLTVAVAMVVVMVVADVVAAVGEIDVNFSAMNPAFDETMESHLNYDAILLQLLQTDRMI